MDGFKFVKNLRNLSVEQRFHDELISLPQRAQRQVARVLRDIRRDPFHDAARVANYQSIWRRRAGEYRILYTPTSGSIHVQSVQHRRSVYRQSITEATAPDISIVVEQLQSPIEEVSPSVGRQIIESLQLENHRLPIELLEVIAECKSLDDLGQLIDLGVPDYVFDLLWDEFRKLNAREQQSSQVNIRLLTSKIIDGFFERVFAVRRSSPISELTIISPWITTWHGDSSSFDALVKFIRARDLRVRVVTRPPEMESHSEAVNRLAALPKVKIFYLANLHAKFMICDVAPVPFAVIGSANITTRSQSNYEVGVLVRGAGQAETVIRELEALVIDLQAIGAYRESA